MNTKRAQPVLMPREPFLEMMADWAARARYRDKKDLHHWFNDKLIAGEIQLHPVTMFNAEQYIFTLHTWT